MRTLATALVVGALGFAPVANADLVGSIRITPPGVHGRIDIGHLPQPPAVIVPRPVVIQPPRVVAPQPVQPVYLWVPPDHRKDWRKHCGKYNACGAPVYFVRHDWYEQHVMEPHRRGHGHAKGHGKGKKNKDKD